MPEDSGITETVPKVSKVPKAPCPFDKDQEKKSTRVKDSILPYPSTAGVKAEPKDDSPKFRPSKYPHNFEEPSVGAPKSKV